MRRWLSFSIAAAMLAGAGCSGAGFDACALIDGHTFVSVNKMDCGLGPNGTVTSCNWSVMFSAGTYAWSHSDVVAGGSYSCNGATISAKPDVATTTPLLGRLDPMTGQLTWDGATYLVQ